jgi:hypothetical protein
MIRRMLAVARIVLACGAAWLLGSAPAWACGEGRVAAARHAEAAARGAPLVLGDSTMIFAAPILGLMGMTTDAHGCRQFDQGVAMLAARRRAHALHPYAVLALGANGRVGDGQIERALHVMGVDRVLGLVTPRNDAATAAAMRRVATRHPDRVLLIDWARYSAGHGSWFAGDGLHVGFAGAAAYAAFIRRASDPLMPPAPDHLHLTRGVRGATRCGRGARGRVYIVYGPARATCADARLVVRDGPLHVRRRWRGWDFARAGRGGWLAVYARRDRRVVIATRR